MCFSKAYLAKIKIIQPYSTKFSLKANSIITLKSS